MPRVEGHTTHARWWFDTDELLRKLEVATTQAIDETIEDIAVKAAADAPKDTGTLASSIRQLTPTRRVKGKLRGHVGSLLHYSFINETRHRTKARFLRNATAKYAPTIPDRIRRNMNRLH